MSRSRRIRRERERIRGASRRGDERVPVAERAPEPPVARAGWLLAAAFLLPNLGAMACRFVLDDIPLIVENEKLHSLRRLASLWTSGYWPDRPGITAYRPVAQSFWALLWVLGGGRPWVFHAFGLLLGLAAVLLAYRFFHAARTPPRAAFIAALLFAAFPIHTEATTSAVGSAELLAVVCGLGAVLLYWRGRPLVALLLFALAVFSKESAAAFAALPLLWSAAEERSKVQGPRSKVAHHQTLDLGPWTLDRNRILAALGAAIIIAAALVAHRAVTKAGFIPAIDNPMALVDPARRILTALWVQCLYAAKTLVPATLSADYSYKQIPLVMSLDDARAWAAVGLLAAAVWIAWRSRQLRPALLTWAVLFSASANVLFPIGTMMGERLAYAPSLGLALLAGLLLARGPYWKPIVLALVLAYGTRTAARNLDWRNADVFYTRLLETSPDSAKSHYFYGILLSARENDAGAVEAYDRAIAIFPAYSEAYHNRGNALARLGRREEAAESYRACLRFDPGHAGAAANLAALAAGLPLSPPRKHL